MTPDPQLEKSQGRVGAATNATCSFSVFPSLLSLLPLNFKPAIPFYNEGGLGFLRCVSFSVIELHVQSVSLLSPREEQLLVSTSPLFRRSSPSSQNVIQDSKALTCSPSTGSKGYSESAKGLHRFSMRAAISNMLLFSFNVHWTDFVFLL